MTIKTFVKAWMESDTLSEVARKTHLSKQAASAKAVQLRAKGVKLPRKNPVHTEHIDVDELNAMIARYTKK